MRKLYALVVSAVLLASITSANAQTYSISSYLTRVFSGAYNDINGTTIDAVKAGGYQYNYYYMSNEITMPFNFRFINIVTNKVKTDATGNVIFGLPDRILYDYYNYNGQ